jgi:hypothetical protein
LGRWLGMAKKRIAAEELAWIFHERLAELCGHRIPIAIVPVGDKWSAQTSAMARRHRADCVAMFGVIEAELDEHFILKKDQTAPRRAQPAQKKDPPFKPGDRVRLTKLGMKNSPKLKSYTGVVIKKGVAGNVVRVLIDGRIMPITLHVSYVEKQ